jgi:hypothetical protein
MSDNETLLNRTPIEEETSTSKFEELIASNALHYSHHDSFRKWINLEEKRLLETTRKDHSNIIIAMNITTIPSTIAIHTMNGSTFKFKKIQENGEIEENQLYESLANLLFNFDPRLSINRITIRILSNYYLYKLEAVENELYEYRSQDFEFIYFKDIDIRIRVPINRPPEHLYNYYEWITSTFNLLKY